MPGVLISTGRRRASSPGLDSLAAIVPHWHEVAGWKLNQIGSLRLAPRLRAGVAAVPGPRRQRLTRMANPSTVSGALAPRVSAIPAPISQGHDLQLP